MPEGGKNMIIVAGSLRIINDQASGFTQAAYRLFQPNDFTRIGAVAHLWVGLDPSLKYHFQVYHNPKAEYQIDRNVFTGWPQFMFNRKTKIWEQIDV